MCPLCFCLQYNVEDKCKYIYNEYKYKKWEQTSLLVFEGTILYFTIKYDVNCRVFIDTFYQIEEEVSFILVYQECGGCVAVWFMFCFIITGGAKFYQVLFLHMLM